MSNGEGGNASDITAHGSGHGQHGGSQNSGIGSLQGSMPAQMLGRSYIKYRSASGAHKSDQGVTPMSLTASSFDIREGSARLASLGLFEEIDQDDFSNEGLGAVPYPVASPAALNDEQESLLAAVQKTPVASTPNTPSGLSMLIQKHEGKSPPASLSPGASADQGNSSSSGSDTVGLATPVARSLQTTTLPALDNASDGPSGAAPESQEAGKQTKTKPTDVSVAKHTLGLPSEAVTERSPLLRKSSSPRLRPESARAQAANGHADESVKIKTKPRRTWQKWLDTRKEALSSYSASLREQTQKTTLKDVGRKVVLEPIATLPAVILGILLNLLDGVSYGMIMFPVSSPVFATFGGIGVSMFFASCFVSQLVYSSRSIFKGGNGSMMIEVVPFLHVIAFTISDRLGGMEAEHAVVATTMVAYALTALLTGLVFFLLGWLRLGALTEFFPRVVLVGCIGGVGAFLIITGIEVCAGLENETLEFSIPVLKRFFEPHLFMLWFVPMLLAIVIRAITSSRFNHQLVFPIYMLAIPILFWIIVLAARVPMADLREGGWLFNLAGVDTPWYTYLTLYDFKAVHWGTLMETIPTQLALVFFALLHVPINVPALALSLQEDNVDTTKELVNHGLSNFFSGVVGSIPNYLVYTNSVLFYSVGGSTRLASFMLAGATLIVFLIGPWVIGYLPVMVVGTLIYVLGYDLMKEAVWDSWGRVSNFEYAIIWIIIAAMTYFDFVVGIGVGIVAACISFVIVSSQRQPIRTIMSGATATSTVRRHPRQSAFLRKIGSQTRAIRLQGFLFFGTIVKVEAIMREMLDEAAWQENPIRFLLVDFTLASGVDCSAAEAFLRVQRLLQTKGVVLILCGCDQSTPAGKALASVDLFSPRMLDEGQVKVFSTLNDALEYCENTQLRNLYAKVLEPSSQQPASPLPDPTRLGLETGYKPPEHLTNLIHAGSPRRSHLMRAAAETFVSPRKLSNSGTRPTVIPPTPRSQTPVPTGIASTKPGSGTSAGTHKIQLAEPIRLLMQALGPYAPDLKEDFYHKVGQYFSKLSVSQGEILWRPNETATSLYVVEHGILKAIYHFSDHERRITESMLPGTIAGEMTFLAGSKRNATVVAERDCVLWELTDAKLAQLEEKEGPEVSRALRQCLLRVSAESADVLMGHLISG